jgi:SAM-dependent methyltransferase
LKLSSIRGLKFPDEYLVRFFFKEGLHATPGRALELGCGNGNNLALFAQYNWSVVGLDSDPNAIADAHANFQEYGFIKQSCDISENDINQSVIGLLKGQFDCLSLANVVYYLARDRYHALLAELRPLLAPRCAVFLRARTLQDYRCGRGILIGKNAWRLTASETGEQGCIMTLYEQTEMIEQLVDGLGVGRESLRMFQLDYENLQGGRVIANSDLVMWGRIP